MSFWIFLIPREEWWWEDCGALEVVTDGGMLTRGFARRLIRYLPGEGLLIGTFEDLSRNTQSMENKHPRE